MYRVFPLTRKLLQPASLAAQLKNGVTPQLTVLYDTRRSRYEKQCQEYTLLHMSSRHTLVPLNTWVPRPLRRTETLWTLQTVRWASEKKGFQVPNPSQVACNYINMLQCVDLQDLKDAPPIHFWTALILGGSQLVIPFLEVIGGYSPTMTYFQLYAAAVALGVKGGIKWSLATQEAAGLCPTWEHLRWALLPPVIAIVGLSLPYPLGFLTLGAGYVTSLYLDLKSCAFPPWALATRLLITLSTVTGLILSLAAYVMFHNKEKANKKLDDEKEDDEVTGKDQNQEKPQEKPQNGE